jgi:hypothetical protein
VKNGLNYESFIASKHVDTPSFGFEVDVLSPHLFAFQEQIVRWALRRGRAAIFADTGLGKSAMQIEWAHRVALQTGKRVLLIAPLAVAQQTVREAEKFGVTIRYAQDGSDVGAAQLVITNYERLERFDFGDFAGVVLDESGILKSFMGKTKRDLVLRCKNVPYRLACTATPAPNDVDRHDYALVHQRHESVWKLPTQGPRSCAILELGSFVGSVLRDAV